MITAPTTLSSAITLNWVKLFEEQGATNEELLTWVQNYPRKSDIHVVIPSKQRSLQRTLQSLGCKVTKMTHFSECVPA